MAYEYKALRGRIIEKYGTQGNFAETLDISKTAMSNKMNNKAGFDQKDIEKWCDLLDIERGNIEHYFFT